MGLSNAISGGIIMFGITYVIFAFGGMTDNAVSFSETSSQVSNLENEILKTSISVAIESNPGADQTFNFDITNTNQEKLWDFEKFDIIITYDSNGQTYTQAMIYVSNCSPDDGEWCIETWTNDILDPEILNYGEIITVGVKVDNNIESGKNLIVVVSTPNGIVATDTTIV